MLMGRGEQAFLTLTAPGSRQHHDTVHGGVCACTPAGGVEPGIFNAGLPRRWNRFCQALRRLHGYRFAYFRAIETQSRGALHEHVLLVCPDPARRLVLDVARLRRLAISHGYGHALRVERVRTAAGTASYVAKYVSKSADERVEVPWVDAATGETSRASYRTWSASRDWGLRMGEVVEAQRVWAREREASLDNNTQTYTRLLPAPSAQSATAAAVMAIESVFGPCEVLT
jgi:hypothetical protein